MTLEALTDFFLWCLILNTAFLLFSTLMISALKDFAISMHRKMFDISEATLEKLYFQYLARFKILIIVFNLTPYIALRLIA